MNNYQHESGVAPDQDLWATAEGLLSPDPFIRESSLDRLKEIDGYSQSPLVAYLLVSRISEPDLEIRFRLIKLLGTLLDYDSPGQHFTDQALVFAQEALDQIDKPRLIKILQVSDNYLAAEGAINQILKMSSYAGVGLSGIVNDRNLPVSLRQQAVYFCGEVGYLSSRPTLQNLIQRVEKLRNRSGEAGERKKSRDEEYLYPFVKSALEKLIS